MNADSRWSVQKAVVTALKEDAQIDALVDGRVYDHVPQGSAFPYIVIGDISGSPYDTVADTGMQLSLNVLCWSRYRGRKELREMQAAIYNALHRVPLTLTDQDHIDTLFLSSSDGQEGDGLTYFGAQSFVIWTEPTT